MNQLNAKSPQLYNQTAGDGRKVARNQAIRAVLAISFGSVLLCFVGITVQYVRVCLKLEKTESEVLKAGLPVTVNELDTWYYPPVRDDINAALRYEDAFQLLEKIDPGRARLKALWESESPSRIRDYAPELLEPIQRYVSDARPVLEKLELASYRELSRYPIDLTRGYEVELPHLSPLRDCARLLAFASIDALAIGSAGDAIAYQSQILQAANSLSQEPTAISQLVVIALKQIALEQLRLTTDHTELDEKQLQTLDRAYAAAYIPDALQRAMVGERCLITYTVQSIFHGSGNESADLASEQLGFFGKLPGPFKTYASANEQLKFYEAYKPITYEPDPHWPTVAERASRWSAAKVPNGMVSAEFPEMERTPMAFVRGMAHLRLARTAIAVEGYRLSNGQLPINLSQCAPRYFATIPEDPTTGSPIHYRREQDGYMLYSFGDDLDDDSGRPLNKLANGEFDGDIAIRVYR